MSRTVAAQTSLWTPQGEVNVNPGVEPISQNELRMLSMLHEFAQKHLLTVTCQRCGQGLQGRNQSPAQTRFVVACGCTEYVYDR